MELLFVASLRLCVFALKVFGMVAVGKDRAAAGCSRNSTPRRKAAKTQPDFFITKPGNQEASKRFHGFRASLWNCFESRLCALAALR
jgi:hypothetical protein